MYHSERSAVVRLCFNKNLIVVLEILLRLVGIKNILSEASCVGDYLNWPTFRIKRATDRPGPPPTQPGPLGNPLEFDPTMSWLASGTPLLETEYPPLDTLPLMSHVFTAHRDYIYWYNLSPTLGAHGGFSSRVCNFIIHFQGKLTIFHINACYLQQRFTNKLRGSLLFKVIQIKKLFTFYRGELKYSQFYAGYSKLKHVA